MIKYNEEIILDRINIMKVHRDIDIDDDHGDGDDESDGDYPKDSSVANKIIFCFFLS